MGTLRRPTATPGGPRAKPSPGHDDCCSVPAEDRRGQGRANVPDSFVGIVGLLGRDPGSEAAGTGALSLAGHDPALGTDTHSLISLKPCQLRL